jgi:hypothetical protein
VHAVTILSSGATRDLIRIDIGFEDEGLKLSLTHDAASRIIPP